MKKKTKLIMLMFVIGAFSLSCEKIDDGEYIAPITLYEKVKGTWKLNDISQIDETAKIAGIAPDEISLFGQFGFDDFNITLDVDDNDQPTSYKVSGSAPELFPKEGFWDLNPLFPVAAGTAPVINLYSDAAKNNLAGQLSIVSIPGAKAEMELKLTRRTAGVPFVSYHYKLSNTNQ